MNFYGMKNVNGNCVESDVLECRYRTPLIKYGLLLALRYNSRFTFSRQRAV